MAKIKKYFFTRIEAEAFCDGLEYVNDSSIFDIELCVDGDGYEVSFLDEDKEPKEC